MAMNGNKPSTLMAIPLPLTPVKAAVTHGQVDDVPDIAAPQIEDLLVEAIFQQRERGRRNHFGTEQANYRV